MTDLGPPGGDSSSQSGTSQRVLSGFLAMSVSSLAVMILQMGYAAGTSRLLPVSAFGAYAVALTGIGLLSLLNGSTMGLAVARRISAAPGADRGHVTLSLATGLTVMVFAILVSVGWSALWDVPSAAPVMAVLALGTPFVAVSAVFAGLLRRQGRTTVVARRSSAAQAVGMAVGLAAVLASKAVWSLAVSSVVAAAFTTILLGRALSGEEIRPGRPGRHLLEDAVYSLKAAGMNVLRYSANLLTPWSISRFAGADALGAYNRATTLVTNPLETLQTAFSYSLFPELRPNGPVFGRPEAFTQIMVLLTWPAVVVLGLGMPAAGPFLTVLLGPAWAAASAIGGLAVLLGVIPMLGVPILAGIEALGEFRIAARAWVVSVLLVAVGAVFTWTTRDPDYAIIGLIVAKAAAALVGLVHLTRSGRFRPAAYLRGVLPILVLQTAVTVAVVLALGLLPDMPALRLGLVAVAGSVEVAILVASRHRTAFGRIARRQGLPGFR